MQPIKEYTTPDGCVTFVMVSRTTIDIEIAQDQLDHALPDYSEAGKSVQNLAFAYKLVLAHTDEIKFNGVDEDSEWFGFKQWWEGDHKSQLERWKAFSATFERDEINAWVDAYDATRAKNRKAPETLHPGAEERAKDDPDFLEGGSATSASGGGSSAKSPGQKKQSRPSKSASVTEAQNAS